MRDKTMGLLEIQLEIYNKHLLTLDNYYKSIEVNEKTIEVCNGYIRDRVRLKGNIESLVRFRVRYCEEMI